MAIEIAFDGVGIGKMLAPLARRGASKEVAPRVSTSRTSLRLG